MMIKYSFIIPYYKRPQLDITLNSYSYFYNYRKDFEIIIVEDSKNFKSTSDHATLMSIIKKYSSSLNITTIVDPKESYNPASKYNRGVKKSLGEIIVLTNPEIVHIIDVLSKIDSVNLENIYISCACLSVKLIEKNNNFLLNKYKAIQWYQHSIHRNANYHFCSFILKKNYHLIGGFNEIFCNGIAYEDDNFIKRVQKKLTIIPRDDLLTYHIEHDRLYSLSQAEYFKLLEINKKIWIEQIKTNNF